MDENNDGILPSAVGEEEYAGKEEYVEEVSTPGLIFEDKDGYYTVTGYRGEDSEVVIPASFEGHPVTSIGDGAFEGCTYLTGISIPNGVTAMGERAFSGCTSLVSVAIPNSLKYIHRRTFYGCTSLAGVTLGDRVKHIGIGAFEGCTSLRDITIPNSVTNITVEAFSGCTSLMDINIPRSVARIEGHAFRGCENLTISCEAKRQPTGWSKHWNRNGGRVVWGAAREKGGAGSNQRKKTIFLSLIAVLILGVIIAVAGLSNTKLVMTDMGDYYEVSGYKGVLTEVIIPQKYRGRPVSSIGDNAFSGHSGITKVTIPSSVTSIGAYAFGGCTSLSSITIPAGVTGIGSSAFDGCEGLTIYCEATEQPSGWDAHWNSSACPVVWGHKGE